MQIYIASRGIKNSMDRWITELNSTYLPIMYNGQKRALQVAVRELKFYEIGFPEEHLDIMLNTIFQGGEVTNKAKYPKYQKYLWGLRKALGIKKLPEVYDKSVKLPCFNQDLDHIGIGMKKDYYVLKDGTTAYNPTDEQKKNIAHEGI